MLNTFYLSHTAIVREDMSTSKVIKIFNVSTHAKCELPLNDCLDTGFEILILELSTLIKFRKFLKAITLDIQ